MNAFTGQFLVYHIQKLEFLKKITIFNSNICKDEQKNDRLICLLSSLIGDGNGAR